MMDVAPVLGLLEKLVQIGAPTGREHARAAFVAKWLADAGLGQPRVDDDGNVWLWLGPQGRQALMIDAHLDTVFPDPHVMLHKHGERWQALGISDNTVHVAMLMAWAKARQSAGQGWQPTVLSFTTGEEGHGNLRGIREVMRRLQERISQVVVLDGGLRTAVHQAVGSIRWQVAFSTPGGHSWSDFGKPSALHAVCQWVAGVEQMASWRPEHTTWNVGHITGGQTINTIAPHATFSLEIRSVDASLLVGLGARIEEDLSRFVDAQPGLQVQVQRTGERPAGSTAAEHPLVLAVKQIHAELGIEHCSGVGSTNANWPMHLGIPAICIGLARGRGGHTVEDSIDISTLPTGLAKLDRLFTLLTSSSTSPPC